MAYLLKKRKKNANDVQFRTGWFVESVISAALIVLVVQLCAAGDHFTRVNPGSIS